MFLTMIPNGSFSFENRTFPQGLPNSNRTKFLDPWSRISGPNWSFVPVYYVAVALAAFFTNGSVMLAFFLKRPLRTAFNIYLMNLVTANFVYTCLRSPPDIINTLYSGWWLGYGYCAVNQFGTYILAGGIRVGHTMITVNRLWAVLRPNHYRQNHSHRTACLLCLSGWVYVLLNFLPGYIMEIAYYHLLMVVNTCRLNADAQWVWLFIMQITVFSLALVVMVGAYPVIWYKRSERNRGIRAGQIVPSSGATKKTHPPISDTSQPTDSHAPPAEAVLQVMDRQAGADQMRRKPLRGVRKRGRESSHAFTILTVLTVGVVVSWTPIMSYFIITIFIPVKALFLQIAIALSAMQALIDPVLFVCALPDLRETFRRLLGCRRSTGVRFFLG